jgi:hypothetical protein
MRSTIASYLDQIQSAHSVKALEIAAFVQMFYGTAYIVDIAHKVMVATADEQLRLALKLLPRPSYSRKDKAFDAAAVLVNAIDHFCSDSRIDVDLKRAKQAPAAAGNGFGREGLEVFSQLCGKLDVLTSDRWIVIRDERDGGIQVLLLPNANFSATTRSRDQYGPVRWRKGAA